MPPKAQRQSWQAIVQEYRTTLASKIPDSLILPPALVQSITESSMASVLHIPRACGLLTEQELDITESYDAVALLEKIASKEFTSHTVTTAFCKRAAIAQQLTFCLTETMFEDALTRAAYCDKYLEEEGKTLGPFHGLPISLTDSFNIEGIASTTGLIEFIKNGPASEGSALVRILLSQGAVFHVKTNVPQTLMTPDTHNNLFGRTLNPYRLCLTAGGCSGGEAALIAMRGSILGVGIDIAGSIRIPSMCCGVVGFKPSTRRIPFGGQMSPLRQGGFGIFPSAGPLCHYARDAAYFTKNVLDYDAWTLDEGVLSVPWREPDPTSTVKTFGVILEDPKNPLHPSVLRNTRSALHKLALAGHRLISLVAEFDKDILSSSAMTAMTILAMDPERTPIGFVARGNEPPIPSIATSSVPELARIKPNINGVFHLNTEISRIQAQFRKVIVEKNLDAILMPPYQATAVPHDTFGPHVYAVLANLLDYPACAIPFGKANRTLDAAFIRDVPYAPGYYPDVVEEAPCSIQVLGRPMKDEELLANAQIIEHILRA